MGDRRSSGRGWLSLLLLAVLAGAASASIAWVVTDHLEQDNDFCNACHLEPDLPLHIELRRDFDLRPAASLAGVHGVAVGRGDDAFRCIDCHGGDGVVGRARVKLLAGLDTFWYVTGNFAEPDGMGWPLEDRDCTKCHASFDESEGPDWLPPDFHQLPVHNVDLGVDCVECHEVHQAGGNPDAYFLRASWLRSQCARCHVEYEEGT